VFLMDNAEDPTQPKVKLLDWGIAKVISADVRHTIEGQLVGTPQYLSPEQARGAAVNPQTDVYSLGVMAYELFLEQLPFEAETSAEIMAMHLRCTPPPPSEMWPDIPSTLENLLLAMLAKDPDARPSMLTVAHTLEQVRAELEERKHKAGANDEPPARPSTRIATVLPFERRSNRFAAAGAGLAPTEKADEITAWPSSTPRRLPAMLGAIALAASTLLFVMSRSSEQAAASTVPASSHIEATAAIERPAAKPTPTPAAPAEIATAPLPTGDTLVVTAPATADAAAPSAKPVKRSAKTVRKLPVKPRREAAIDPNGVLDPY
jgi:serine/threonine-protein kinase